MKKNSLVPELRFPEFMNEKDWKENTLGDCLLQNPEYGMNAPAVPYSDKLPTYLRITDISIDGNFISKSKVSVNRDVTKDNYLSDGDIVLARTGASVGKSYKYRKKDGKLVFAGFLIRVKPNIIKLDSELLFQFLSSNMYWKWVSFISARSGQPGINGTEYSSMPISLPPTINEQQKIASCLSSLDELIASHNKKLDALKDHKKGLMQNLFPQEGEKVPKYRFPDFENDGEWVAMNLESVVNFSSGGTPSKGIEEFWNGDIPWISASSMHKPFIKNSELKITDIAVKNGAKIAKKGGLLILVRGSMLHKRIPICINTRDVAFNQDVKSLVLKKDILNLFLLYLLYSNESKLLELVSATGIGAGKLDTDDLKKLIIHIPLKQEQQKIASCLSSLDAIITAQTESVEQLKAHKKGLMQGLFPQKERV
jgi:type I restriction enzyme, S subunit